MWKHEFSEYADLTPEELWEPLTDIANWGNIDQQIEWVKIEGPPVEGKLFYLKPKGGPKLKLKVELLRKPNEYADICFLPLAKMKTTHSLSPSSDGTDIGVCIEITGLLSFMWQRIVGHQHAAGLRKQTQRLIEVASA
ncbi:MAG: polyketide cyclase [Planctomycetota bacterium]